MTILIKRVYDSPAADDGFRILIDRLWPRGLSKERAAVDLWAKDVAPTAELRTALHHDDMPWDAFVEAYRVELAHNPHLGELRDVVAAHPVVTLLHSVHDAEHNHAVLLRDALRE